jgi:hypothetical protein
VAVEPEKHNGMWFHKGFLSGVRDNSKLKRKLYKYLIKHPDWPLYVIGHSLGGSLALVLACSGLLREWCPDFRGQVWAINFGGPKVMWDPLGNAQAATSNVYNVVCRDDVMPRLLGSRLPSLLGSHPFLRRVKDLFKEQSLIKTLEGYTHPSNAKLIHIKDNEAWIIPPHDQADVLEPISFSTISYLAVGLLPIVYMHVLYSLPLATFTLASQFHRRMLKDHSMKGSYLASLERASFSRDIEGNIEREEVDVLGDDKAKGPDPAREGPSMSFDVDAA